MSRIIPLLRKTCRGRASTAHTSVIILAAEQLQLRDFSAKSCEQRPGVQQTLKSGECEQQIRHSPAFPKASNHQASHITAGTLCWQCSGQHKIKAVPQPSTSHLRPFSQTSAKWSRRQARKAGLSVSGRSVDERRRERGQQQAESKKEVETAAERGLAQSQEDLPLVEPSATKATFIEVARLVRHPALIVTRDIEWGTVILGFEQANKYTVLDQDGNVVALLAEDVGGLGRGLGRQFLRTRRSFTATIFDPEGKILLRLRRPMYLINSTIHVEDGEGEQVGEVRQRFHVWQRNYDVYLGRRQFAAINSPLLAWEFALRDETGGVLALIDRNFQGFGKELFTDAGKYVIHFGDSQEQAAEQVANTVAAAHPDKPRPKVTALAKARTDVAAIPTSAGDQLQVSRSLAVEERILVLAAAVSIDFDYFSQHSHGSGLMPYFFLPMPGSPPVPYPEGGEIPPGPGPVDAGPPSAAGDGSGQQESDGSFDENGTQGFEGQSDLPGSSDQTWDDNSAGWSPGGEDMDSGDGSFFDSIKDIFDSMKD